MQAVCINPQGSHKLGDLVDVPGGAQVSPVHFAEPGSPEALAAESAAAAAEAAADSPPPPAAAPEPPAPFVAAVAAPEGSGM